MNVVVKITVVIMDFCLETPFGIMQISNVDGKTVL